MTMETPSGYVTRRPGRVVLAWIVLAALVASFSPDLTRIAAEGQARLLGGSSESVIGAEALRSSWPDQAVESVAVFVLSRPEGVRPVDSAFADRLVKAFESPDRPECVLRVLGPKSAPELAERLVSRDRTTRLVAVVLSSSFVSPAAHEAVAWLEKRTADPALTPPTGLEAKWTGDAVIGRDYMADVQRSLDRAALVTVALLLAVLWYVYRSPILAMIPLATIGVSLVIARGCLAWMAKAGWEISPLVELFLIVILFGSGTDFCLLVSWRFAENWSRANPSGAMRVTLRHASGALLTSAGTVMIGLLLMGTTQFKLFSSTGPSVALGLAITVAATVTLTPALLVILAKVRPSSFAGFTGNKTRFWEGMGIRVLDRPALYWACGLIVMVPFAAFGTRASFVQDLLSEMPRETRSAETMRELTAKFGAGTVAPLTVVLETDSDFHSSQGLALIDDVSRLMGRQRKLQEVRSATQPLGSPQPLERARLLSRLGEINAGFKTMSDGAKRLHEGLFQGLTKLKAALWLEDKTGLNLTGASKRSPEEDAKATREALAGGFRQAGMALLGQGMPSVWSQAKAATQPTASPAQEPASAATDARKPMVLELTQAVDGAGRLAEGAGRATKEIGAILNDPVGRRALDRLLITPETVRENPELLKSFAAYISEDGKRARIDLNQTSPIFSKEALDQVETIRRRLKDYLEDEETMSVRALVTGSNAGSADVRALTVSDQRWTWFIVPIGVFLVLIVALRDPLACVNLVLTMVLTYLFSLGLTHLIFVSWLGAEGLDWKVPYFLFVLLVAVGVDYNVFLMARLREESSNLGLRTGISRAIAQTGGLISSAAAITAVSFASFMVSPLASLRQLGFALVVGIIVDAVLVRPILVPCGHWLLYRGRENKRLTRLLSPSIGRLSHVTN